MHFLTSLFHFLELVHCILIPDRLHFVLIPDAFFEQMSHEISAICSKLVETAKLCLAPNNKYLQSTIRILNSHMSESPEAGS